MKAYMVFIFSASLNDFKKTRIPFVTGSANNRLLYTLSCLSAISSVTFCNQSRCVNVNSAGGVLLVLLVCGLSSDTISEWVVLIPKAPNSLRNPAS